MGVGDCKSGTFDRVFTTTSNIHKSNRNTSSKGGEIGFLRRGNSEPADKESDRKSSTFAESSDGGVFQQSLSGSKTLRRLPYDFESQKPEQVCESQEIQDGILKIDNTCTGRGAVGMQDRLTGCLLAHSCKRVSQTIPKVCLQEHSLPIPDSSLWLDISTAGIYKGSHNFDRVLTTEGNPNPCLPGRLVAGQQGSSEASKGCGVHSQILEEAGVPRESQEISSVPISNSGVSRGKILLQSRVGHDHGRALDKNSGACHNFSEEPSSVSTPISSSSGIDGFLYRPNNPSKTSHAANSVVFAEQVEARISRSRKDDPGGKNLDGSPIMVDKQKEFVQGSIHSTAVFSETDNSNNRCLVVGLGGTSGRSPIRGSMVSNSPEKPHKLVGTKGNSAISSPVQSSFDGQDSVGQVRQFDSHSLHQKSRGNSVSRPVRSTVGDSQVVRPKQDNLKSDAHSRKKEHPRRCTVKRKSATNRMDSKSDSSKSTISGVGHPPDRHVRVKAKQQVTSVLHKKPRCKSSNGRCTGSRLAGPIPVCVSAADHSPKSTAKDSEGTLHGYINSSKLAKTVLVSNSNKSSNRGANTVTKSARSAVATHVTNRTSVSGDTGPNCMEIIQQQCIEKGFSTSVANRIANSRRGSTIDTYNAKLRIFYRWCNQNHLDPLKASVTDIADFLEYLFKTRGLQTSTISGYRAAIASVHTGWNGISVGESSDLSRLIKNFFQERPPSKSLLPSWSLPLVLSKLVEPPFEPLEKCSLKLLSFKTALLVALASGRRVGDLHALSIKEGNLRWEPYGVRLAPRLHYLAKNESMVHRAKPIFIPKFSTYATDEEDLKLCPVRVLKAYVKATKRRRDDQEQLFVSFQTFKPISKERLSKWITGGLREIYSDASESDLRLNAHSTRSLASSWALYQGASLDSIVKAAFWARESTFSSFYLKDVWGAEGEFAQMVLSTARKSKKINALDPVN